ncbi:hypothetical protein BMW24_001440 [Mycobacterium heckeshornense]|uniref:Uncharacterized protein n=1 Tax=Mycobacterium heckeshornense TaxID=110505 RepID=A0A2G8BJ87_9MYCO|nr:hypothetical protein ACT16_17950 [Mycobacterium heckeshornense]PIJ37798.1 hypothetical protein BMW24_001440 [Mycobacterium heckeshornense]BCO37738.1 hypothetical protein MHEC_41710 [Mycobacterium heckeshornense]BCQ10606.1 hypothetical protein JMUB5695_04064 [Mycobacterium heckeshornense]
MQKLSSAAEFYIAIALIVTIGTMFFIDPDKGKLRKWTYWLIAPLLVVACLSLGFKSVIAGLGFGFPIFVLFAVGYFRYRT